MSFWQDLLGGGIGAGGYYKMYQDLDQQKGDIGNIIGDLQSGLEDRTSFQPWSITSGTGKSGVGPGGNMFMKLNPRTANMQNTLWGQGMDLMGRAAQDPQQREQEIYERMRAGQMPGERRALQNLEQQQFSRGRTGMGTTEYGSSPERFAFEKARAEAQNSAMLGAMGQTQNELMNQYNMGQGMFQQGWTPQQQLMQQAGLGMNNAQMRQQGQLNNANLWAQLGLGGVTAKQNYANMQTKAFGDMMASLANMGRGVGGSIDQAGGLMDFLKSLF